VIIFNAALIFGFQPIIEPESNVFESVTHETKRRKTAPQIWKLWSSSFVFLNNDKNI